MTAIQERSIPQEIARFAWNHKAIIFRAGTTVAGTILLGRELFATRSNGKAISSGDDQMTPQDAMKTLNNPAVGRKDVPLLVRVARALLNHRNSSEVNASNMLEVQIGGSLHDVQINDPDVFVVHARNGRTAIVYKNDT